MKSVYGQLLVLPSAIRVRVNVLSESALQDERGNSMSLSDLALADRAAVFAFCERMRETARLRSEWMRLQEERGA